MKLIAIGSRVFVIAYTYRLFGHLSLKTPWNRNNETLEEKLIVYMGKEKLSMYLVMDSLGYCHEYKREKT